MTYFFKPSSYITTIIIYVILINVIIVIIITVILEKSSGVEFQARHSSDMVYPYSSR